MGLRLLRRERVARSEGEAKQVGRCPRDESQSHSAQAESSMFRVAVTWGSQESSLPEESIVTSRSKAGKLDHWVRVWVGEGEGWAQGRLQHSLGRDQGRGLELKCPGRSRGSQSGLLPAVGSKVTLLHRIRAGLEQWLSRPWEGEERLQGLAPRTESPPERSWGHLIAMWTRLLQRR